MTQRNSEKTQIWKKHGMKTCLYFISSSSSWKPLMLSLCVELTQRGQPAGTEPCYSNERGDRVLERRWLGPSHLQIKNESAAHSLFIFSPTPPPPLPSLSARPEWEGGGRAGDQLSLLIVPTSYHRWRKTRGCWRTSLCEFVCVFLCVGGVCVPKKQPFSSL